MANRATLNDTPRSGGRRGGNSSSARYVVRDKSTNCITICVVSVACATTGL